jgi:hypothetical protein
MCCVCLTSCGLALGWSSCDAQDLDRVHGACAGCMVYVCVCAGQQWMSMRSLQQGHSVPADCGVCRQLQLQHVITKTKGSDKER